jgi:signal transduction histidine kinase
MKLIVKTNLNFLILASFLFLAGSIVFYTLLRTAIVKNIDNELLSIKHDFESKHNQQDTVHPYTNFSEILSKATIVDKNYIIKNQLSDTVLYNENAKDYLLYRQLKFIIKIENKFYLFQIFKPHQNSDDLIVTLILIITFLIIVYIISLFILNRYTLSSSWTGFYKTLTKLEKFDINSNKKFEPEDSEIDEFMNLNNVLVKMTDKIKTDFENLKEYTENTSHELQTPLAVINSKIEILLQTENLDENQMNILSDIYNASIKLSKINKSLIYLAMLDKRRFETNQSVCFNEIINENIAMFDEFIKNKNLQINIENTQKVNIKFNRELANVLISNLIKNAAKHNVNEGFISINLQKDFLEISNSSYYKSENPEDFFQRFKKENSNAHSLGIGLSMVKKICDIFEMPISYKVIGDIHILKISLEKISNTVI